MITAQEKDTYIMLKLYGYTQELEIDTIHTTKLKTFAH